MRYLDRSIFLLLIILMLFALFLACQPAMEVKYGRIVGQVTEPLKGEPFPYAPVELAGTNLGVLADENGQYVIDSIPPGVYDLVVETYQYPRKVLRRLAVHPDSALQIDIQLTSAAGIWTAHHDSLQGMAREREIKRQYDSGYAVGLAEAEWEIANRRASIYTMGFGAGSVNYDLETGLPVVAIAGCIVDSYIQGRADGHNFNIREYIERDGLPEYSRLPWADELSDLQSYFEGRLKMDSLFYLRLAGPAALASNGAASLELRRSRFHKFDIPCLFIKGPRGLRRSGQSIFGTWPDSMSVLWGPPDSDLAFLRWERYAGKGRDSIAYQYAALDLRTGRILNRY